MIMVGYARNSPKDTYCELIPKIGKIKISHDVILINDDKEETRTLNKTNNNNTTDYDSQDSVDSLADLPRSISDYDSRSSESESYHRKNILFLIGHRK